MQKWKLLWIVVISYILYTGLWCALYKIMRYMWNGNDELALYLNIYIICTNLCAFCIMTTNINYTSGWVTDDTMDIFIPNTYI